MKNLPKEIFLNLGEPSDDFENHSEVTWSSDEIGGYNLKYVHQEDFDVNYAGDLFYNPDLFNAEDPKFEETRKVHDWRNYVPFEWMRNWDKLTSREKKIIVIMSEIQADKENWD